MVNAELPNPSSCFIVPLSMGQSLELKPFQLVHCSEDSINRLGELLFICFDMANLATVGALALRACIFRRCVCRG